jgi:hypothetical protein
MLNLKKKLREQSHLMIPSKKIKYSRVKLTKEVSKLQQFPFINGRYIPKFPSGCLKL